MLVFDWSKQNYASMRRVINRFPLMIVNQKKSKAHLFAIHLSACQHFVRLNVIAVPQRSFIQ